MKNKKNQKGMAVIEAIPVIFMLILVFNFSLGFFGAIHSGILNSIGAYNYTYETFRYRSNLMYFRPGVDNRNYSLSLNRVHGIVKDGSEADLDEDKSVWPTTVREITFSSVKINPALNKETESDRKYSGRTSRDNIWFANSIYTPDSTKSILTPRIWIKTVYGICINADCVQGGRPDNRQDE